MKNPFRRRADKGGKKSSAASPSTTSKKATVNGNVRGAGHRGNRAEQAKEDHGMPAQPTPQRSAPQPKSTAAAPLPPSATQLPTTGFEEKTSLDGTGSTATRSVPSTATPDGLSALASMRVAEATEKPHTLPKGIPDAFSDVDPLSNSKKAAKRPAGAETETGWNEAVGVSEDHPSTHKENGEPPRAEAHSKVEEDSEPLTKDDRAQGDGNTQGNGGTSNDGDTHRLVLMDDREAASKEKEGLASGDVGSTAKDISDKGQGTLPASLGAASKAKHKKPVTRTFKELSETSPPTVRDDELNLRESHISDSVHSMPTTSTVTGSVHLRSDPPHANRLSTKNVPRLHTQQSATGKDVIFDDPAVVKSYDSIPLLELTKLPRGGVSMETQAVGRVQFGIPPETIKDSMRLGLGVPSVYIVPVERFCREMGPALGVNLAEFEFPAYFNFFVQRKRCTLIVDSDDAERNIRRVFSETLLGPAQFRREEDPMSHEAEDFSPDFPKEAIPNFQKELKHFRIMPDGKELVLETLLDFCHFNSPGESGAHEGLGIPPPMPEDEKGENAQAGGSEGIASIRSPSSRHTISEMPLSLSSPSLTKLINVEDSKEHKKAEAKRLAEKKRQPVPVPSTEEEMHRSASETNEMIKKMSKVIRNADHLAAEIEPQNEQLDDEFEGGTDSRTWTYSQAKWIGDVSTVYPADATPELIAKRATKRVEIFKMPGGTEYILHDIDENNHIVGKARFSGHVRVSESMGVDGFGGRSMISMDDTPEGIEEEGSVDLEDLVEEEAAENKSSIPGSVLPPTFHPPSFGVTVLGNSHGFDKSGSVSGYVLWINGRGVMIDPPPYSSATLEREGIRPRTIVGIILTHCHADHDAGAFQKVLTGSPVVVITTPTIYKSFIRKYAALSALSPALLRHSHRHKPAIIGDPLRFQGATFHFTYTLHTIPCVGFRVEWRGRSMVFTGDHFNSPPAIDKLQSEGVLSKARADDLRNLPLQECDLLLHEAGAPPIHTPLDVLLKLPPKVKKRLYVVHTSALPDDCELRVAPTGTVGTIRLDQLHKTLPIADRKPLRRTSIKEDVPYQFEDDGLFPSPWNTNEYSVIDDEEKNKQLMDSSFAHLAASPGGGRNKMPLSRMNSILGVQEPPLVSLRPTSSTDAWFILNLLSAVPFLSSLSYSSTMEVLETARVDAFCINDVVVPASRRSQLLCVVWEGTCMEREQSSKTSVNRRRLNDGVAKGRRISTFELTQGCHTPLTEKEAKSKKRVGAVWHAGDWTGPRSLQPEKRLSGESSFSKTHDIVAMSSEGVKVISVEFSNLHAILKSGSPLYRKYLARKSQQHAVAESMPQIGTRHFLDNAVRNLNVIELLDCNSALRKLSAVQKRHLESLAEGPVSFSPGQRLWRSGAAVDKAYIVVAGTVSFVPRRRNAGSVGLPRSSQDMQCFMDNPWGPAQDDDGDGPQPSLGETMRLDAMKAIQELGTRMKEEQPRSGNSSLASAPQAEPPLDRVEKQPEFPPETNELAISASLTDTHDYARLSRGLQKRADQLSLGRKHQAARRGSSSTEASMEKSVQEDTLGSQSSIDFHDLVLDEHDEHLDTKSPDSADEAVEVDITGVPSLTGGKDSGAKDSVAFQDVKGKRANPVRRRSSRDRFANKVLGRLYSRRAFTAGLVFSRGHFLGDVSKMVAGLLSSAYEREHSHYTVEDCDSSVNYGFGEKIETNKPDSAGAPIGEQVIHEQEGNQLVVHSSTLAAGKDGCVVLVFPRHSLIPFLDEFPGLLLSLLGTQVVV